MSEDAFKGFKLAGRTIVVTGASGALGQAVCKTLLLAGADVMGLDLKWERTPEEIASMLEAKHQSVARFETTNCDVTDEDSVNDILEALDQRARFPVRGLVQCAGISGRGPAVDYNIADFRKILEVNLVGSFICARAAARIMHKRSVSGSIVLVGSMSGTNANKGVDTCAYNASKAAVLQLARNLAAEWGAGGEHPPIRVNTLSPGYILTELTVPTLDAMPHLRSLWAEGNMLGRFSNVEEYQSAVLFLLGDGSSYMTGSDLRMDAGHCAW